MVMELDSSLGEAIYIALESREREGASEGEGAREREEARE